MERGFSVRSIARKIAEVFFWVFPKSLTQDVIEVFRQFDQLAKLGLNDEDPDDPYHYLRIVDLCQAFRGELFRRGIIFTATDRDCVFEKVLEDGDYFERCTVTTDFAVIRGRRERLELGSAKGSARDHSDKSLAIAQTAAFKAFMKRSSMIYGKEDDPETGQRETFTPKESVRVASYQRRALDAALNQSGIRGEDLSDELSKRLGFQITVDQIADLPRAEFDEAIKLILSTRKPDDLTSAWSAAVVDIRTKKQQQAAGD